MVKQKHYNIRFFSPLKNWKITPVLCDQVSQCLSSLTINLVSATSTNDVPIIGGSHTIARVHNIARVNCSKCTYFFLKQTENWVPRNCIGLFYSRPCLMFHEMCYILTLHEKHNIENKWPTIRVSNKKTSVERY